MITAHQSSLRVDPRPLRADSVSNADYLGFAESSVADGRQDVVKARSEVLRRLGVPEGDAITASRCPGVGVPLPASERLQECPPGRALIAILGLPRRSGAVRLSGDPGDASGGGPHGYWSIRVLEMDMNQQSRATIVADYVMGWGQSGWTVVKKERLFVLE
jgi:hypothetical protein